MTCGLHLTHFAIPRYPEPEMVYPLSVLRPALRLPASARAGSVLHFLVDLQNPTAHRVALSPCPGYVEAAGVSPPTKRTYALNCASVSAIEAHHTARFAMRLRLPAGETAGPTNVLWSLQAATAPAMGTVVITQ